MVLSQLFFDAALTCGLARFEGEDLGVVVGEEPLLPEGLELPDVHAGGSVRAERAVDSGHARRRAVRERDRHAEASRPRVVVQRRRQDLRTRSIPSSSAPQIPG